jgi:hypothetical protein
MRPSWVNLVSLRFITQRLARELSKDPKFKRRSQNVHFEIMKDFPICFLAVFVGSQLNWSSITNTITINYNIISNINIISAI